MRHDAARLVFNERSMLACGTSMGCETHGGAWHLRGRNRRLRAIPSDVSMSSSTMSGGDGAAVLVRGPNVLVCGPNVLVHRTNTVLNRALSGSRGRLTIHGPRYFD